MKLRASSFFKLNLILYFVEIKFSFQERNNFKPTTWTVMTKVFSEKKNSVYQKIAVILHTSLYNLKTGFWSIIILFIRIQYKWKKNTKYGWQWNYYVDENDENSNSAD